MILVYSGFLEYGRGRSEVTILVSNSSQGLHFPYKYGFIFFGNICKGTPLEPENPDFSLSSRGYIWFEIKLRIGAFERGRSDV
jgi:hypothetical protein